MKTHPAVRSALFVITIGALAVPSVGGVQEKFSKRDARDYIKAAEKAIEEGDPAKAAGLYLTVLNSFPERGDIRFEVARINKEDRKSVV